MKNNSGKKFLAKFIMFIFLAAQFTAFFLETRETFAFEMQNIITVAESGDIASTGFTGQRKIAFDSDNNMYTAYRAKTNGKLQIFVAKFTAESGYSESSKTISQVSKAEVTQRVPSIAIDSKNIIHIAWYGADKKKKINERQIKYSESADGGKTWSKTKNIAFVEGYKKDEYWQEHPDIYTGKNDEIYIVWEGKDKKYKKQQIKFTKSSDSGNTWSKWKNINPVKNNTQSRPSLVQDKTGKMHLLMYSSYNNDNQQIQYSYSTDKGDSWSTWKNISNSDFDSRHASLAIDNAGTLRAAWRAPVKTDGPSQILYAEMNNNIWSKPKVISPSPNYQFFPDICVDENNKTYIVWTESKSSSSFPKEKPENGVLNFSYIGEAYSSSSTIINKDNQNFYPNMPMKLPKLNFIPVIYGSGAESSKIMFGKVYK